jgi:hypothetical protein
MKSTYYDEIPAEELAGVVQSLVDQHGIQGALERIEGGDPRRWWGIRSIVLLDSKFKYRLKRMMIERTVRYPEPMREGLKKGATYYTPSISKGIADCLQQTWWDTAADHSRLALGICHLTAENATAHAAALLGGE